MFKRFSATHRRRNDTNTGQCADHPGSPPLPSHAPAQPFHSSRPAVTPSGQSKPVSDSSFDRLYRYDSPPESTRVNKRRASAKPDFDIASHAPVVKEDLSSGYGNTIIQGNARVVMGNVYRELDCPQNISQHVEPMSRAGHRHQDNINEGLQLIHDPVQQHCADIVLVHGLGGYSIHNWSWNHDPEFFWPSLWLPRDPNVSTARIFTYGYNPSYLTGARPISGITDFATALLYDLRFASSPAGNSLKIGSVPIIFIAHSFAGLVIKKACLLGQADERYEELVSAVQGFIFLSTPHRGSQLAFTLQKVLAINLGSFDRSISDLSALSRAFEEVNRSFQDWAERFDIFSFYETRETPLTTTSNLMVVDSETAQMRCPNEVSASLDADHNTVCQYRSPEDANFIKILNAAKSLLSKPSHSSIATQPCPGIEAQMDMKRRLRIEADPESDLRGLRERRFKDTCTWISTEEGISDWLDGRSGPPLLWYAAPPASGKSVLSSYVVDYLETKGFACQYFFFRYGDQTRRSSADMLRSIAYQAACSDLTFYKELVGMLESGNALEKSDASLLWHKVIESAVFRGCRKRPNFWVIDAIDESDSTQNLFDLMRTTTTSDIPLRIFVTGRRTETLFKSFTQLTQKFPSRLLDMEGVDFNNQDIRLFAEAEISHMRGSSEFKRHILRTIMRCAGSSFLWVKLVLDEIGDCDREQDILDTLDEMPEDMTALYQRMEESIIKTSTRRRRGPGLALTKALLEWTILTPNRMTLVELQQAIEPEHNGILDLKRTIRDVCGQFIFVDESGHVSMLHQTAREYLVHTSTSTLSIGDKAQSHERLLSRCLTELSSPEVRTGLTDHRLSLASTKPFLFHAATTWMHHLQQVEPLTNSVLDMLSVFFRASSVLSWIHLLALMDQLHIVVRAAKAIDKVVTKYRRLNATRNPMLHQLKELDLLENWAIDLVKVVGKFNRQLRLDPLVVYKFLPALCPSSSALHRQFYLDAARSVIISTPDETWNDNLAKLSPSGGEQPEKITCAGPYIAVLASASSSEDSTAVTSSTIYIWTTNDFKEACKMQNSESITAFCLNSKGDKLAAYGLKTTKIWAVPSGKLLISTTNPAKSLAMTIVFADEDKKIVIVCNDRSVQQYELDGSRGGWYSVNTSLLQEDDETDKYANAPMCASFNYDGSQLAVGYRGFPLSVWSVQRGTLIERCRRSNASKQHGETRSDWWGVDQLTWNPVTGHVIAMYRDGCIFKWHPVTGEYHEAQSAADEVACSADGKLFATSNSMGIIRVWDFSFFTPIYQLSSDDLVTGLTFSPDGTRLYDTRSTAAAVNVWEPNNLVHFAELGDSANDAASSSHQSTLVSQASEATIAEVEPISSLLASPSGQYYCMGNEIGTVWVKSLLSTKTIEIAAFPNYLSVHQLSWAEHAPCFACADLGGDVVMFNVTHTDGDSSSELRVQEIKPRPQLRLEEQAIHQICLSPDGTLLLVVCAGKHVDVLLLWDVNNTELITSRQLDGATLRSWIRHPQKSSILLGIGPKDILFYSWVTLLPLSCVSLDQPPPSLSRLGSQDLSPSRGILNRSGSRDMSPDASLQTSLSELTLTRTTSRRDTAAFVRKPRVSFDKKYILLQVQQYSSQGQVTKRTNIVSIDALDAAAAATDTPIAYDPGHSGLANEPMTGTPLDSLQIPPHVMSRIEVPLGVLPGPRLVFLDQDLWICSHRLHSTYSSSATHLTINRHCFIPRDWTSTDCLEQCCLTAVGTLLVPRGGDVVSIKRNIGSLLDI